MSSSLRRGGGGLLAAFPLAYSLILSALYAPIIAMLLALVFRGVAFEFRERSQGMRWLWDWGFFLGSVVVAFYEQGRLKMAHLSRGEAEAFYAVHKARPFFNDLVKFMISGPVMIQVLEGEGAIAKNRELMGATDPKKADKGTIRADFADSIDANAVHGSDAAETAAVEIAFFFAGMNVYSR